METLLLKQDGMNSSNEELNLQLQELLKENARLKDIESQFLTLVQKFPFIVLNVLQDGTAYLIAGKELASFNINLKDGKINLLNDLPPYDGDIKGNIERAFKGEEFLVKNWFMGHFFEVCYIPNFNHDHQVQSITLVCHIITNQYYNDTRIEKERKYAAKAQEMGKIGIWERNYLENTIYWSEQMFVIHGIESQKEPLDEVYLDYIFDEDRGILQDTYAKATPVNPSFRVAYRMSHFKSGATLHLIMYGEVSFDDQGNIVKVFGITQDNTATRLLEIENSLYKERLIHILENLPSAFFSIDKQWRFIYANKMCENLLADTDLINKPLFEVLPTIKGTIFEECFSLAMAQGIVSNFESYVLVFDKWFSVNVQPSHEGISVQLTDITHRKQTEKALRDLNDAKTGFLKILAHDMKGPFNSIIGLTNLATASPQAISAEELSMLMSELNGTAKNLHNLLDNLLTWSNAQMGQLELKPSYVSLVEIADFTCNLFAYQAHHKQIQIINKVQNEAHQWMADRQAIETIIRNLVSNSIKFTKSGGNVELSSYMENNRLVLAVKDTGVGIPESMQNDLFNVGKKFTLEGTNGEKGSGFGIKLAKELVEKNHGKISLESNKRGTTFYVSLPLAK